MFDIITSLLESISGGFGGSIANEIANKNRKLNIPVFMLFSILFTLTYNLGLLFFYFVYKIKGYEIPWLSLTLVCLGFSVVVAIIFLLEKLNKK
ncbi:hypothetical protein MOMA_04480 [Moraxella macacae 0408225]|uniref:Uncharacterized protein n=1 Tax=Moraxella macacae 0408225 TaxID=1230338 RepID=L2F9D0_9GAMM|nr:hypothetical protein MOMA_04480 [Moraxella macacae 0408225]